MVDGGSNVNDTQAYSKVLTLGSVLAKIQLDITICRFIELSNPTKRPYIYILCKWCWNVSFGRKKKFIFANRVIESHFRPVKAKWRKIWLECSSPLKTSWRLAKNKLYDHHSLGNSNVFVKSSILYSPRGSTIGMSVCFMLNIFLGKPA